MKSFWRAALGFTGRLPSARTIRASSDEPDIVGDPAITPSRLTRVNPYTSNSALQELKNGNQRFVDNQLLHPNRDKALRAKLSASGQTPLAAVLSCSDSRVPMELVFDLGFGDLFVVRVAGNVPGMDALGSIEYAVAYLGVPLVVVLGHTQCGAVAAALKGSAEQSGALGQLLARLMPAARIVADLPPDLQAAAAVKKNVELGVSEMTSQSPTLAQAVREDRIKIIGAVYQLEDGRVIFD